jgi:hypothetical protein
MDWVQLYRLWYTTYLNIQTCLAATGSSGTCIQAQLADSVFLSRLSELEYSLQKPMLEDDHEIPSATYRLMLYIYIYIYIHTQAFDRTDGPVCTLDRIEPFANKNSTICFVAKKKLALRQQCQTAIKPEQYTERIIKTLAHMSLIRTSHMLRTLSKCAPAGDSL